MFYILSLILMLGLIFSAVSGVNFTDDLWNKTMAKFQEFAFPKTQNETMIDNLNSQYNLLDKFFSDTALDLLQNKDVPAEDKKAIQNAIQSFGNSKNLVSQVENLAKNNKSVTKTIVEKVFDLNAEPRQEATRTPLLEGSQNTIEQLKNMGKEGKSATQALVEQVFNLDAKPSPELTSIPPNCNP